MQTRNEDSAHFPKEQELRERVAKYKSKEECKLVRTGRQMESWSSAFQYSVYAMVHWSI